MSLTEKINSALPTTLSKFLAGISLVTALSGGYSCIKNYNERSNIDKKYETAQIEVQRAIKVATAKVIGEMNATSQKPLFINSMPELVKTTETNALITDTINGNPLKSVITEVKKMNTNLKALINKNPKKLDAEDVRNIQKSLKLVISPKFKQFEKYNSVSINTKQLYNNLNRLYDAISSIPDKEKPSYWNSIMLLFFAALTGGGAFAAANKDKIKAWKERKREEKETETENEESTDNDKSTDNDEESEPNPLSARETWEQFSSTESDPDSMEINKKIEKIWQEIDRLKSIADYSEESDGELSDGEKTNAISALKRSINKAKLLLNISVDYQKLVITEQINTAQIMIDKIDKSIK